MTDAHIENDTLDAPSPSGTPRNIDFWLNTALIVLAIAAIGGAGFFGWTVYKNRQAENSTSAAGRVADAISQQIRKNPNDAVLRVRLGEAYSDMGRYPDAIAQFNAALKINPKHVGAYLDLGVVAMTTQNYDQAKIFFQKVIDLTEADQYQGIDETRESAYYNLGLVAMAQKRYSDAAGFFKGALRIRSDASDTYFQLAHALSALGDDDSAIQQLELGLQFDPGFAEMHFYLGQLHQKQGDLVNAAYEYKKAAALAPQADPPRQALDALGSASDWIAKARKQAAAGDLETAVTSILIARNLDPSSFEAAKVHGDILVLRKDLKDALDVYKAALALNPSDAAMRATVADLKTKVPVVKSSQSTKAAKKGAKTSTSK